MREDVKTNDFYDQADEQDPCTAINCSADDSSVDLHSGSEYFGCLTLISHNYNPETA